MSEITFRYSNEKSNIFENIKRPRIRVYVYSKVFKEWVTIDDVLADTGADVSILPKTLGIVLVGKISNRRRFKINGMVSHTFAYIHELRTRLNGREIKATYAIANSDDIPPTLGRMGGLDKFKVTFEKGRVLKFS
ncbi:MAG: hypothetical protein GY855_01730 [candidate division Zixibacteria bacterium]|nr:hypothetical protein [candidate division Zixibacteria bacterium]